MALIIPLIIFVGLALVIVWLADWTSGAQRYTALASLDRRLASGEIDRAEYEEKANRLVRSAARNGAKMRKRPNNPTDD